MRRVAAALVAATLVLTACTGGGDDKKADGPSLPLPPKAPSARGPATGPALEAKVLLASTDDLEEQAGALDTAQVDRRSGAFVSGSKVVGYSVDNVSGYDLRSGEKLWTAKLDLGGGTVCFTSQPDRAVKQLTVVYGESGFCSDVATIRVSDGKVLKKSDRLNGMVQFQGEGAGGSVNHLFTVKGKDYLVDMRGVVWVMKKDGQPDPVAKLKADSYFGLLPTPGKDVLIGSRLGSNPTCMVDAYELPSFEPIWTQDNATLFPEAKQDCVISAAKGNPSWLAQQVGTRQYLTQVDPKTGKVLGRADGPTQNEGPTPAGQLDVASAALHLDTTLGLPDGDMVFAQASGISRYSLADKKMLWDLDLGQLELKSDQEYPLTDVLPQGVTKDGYLVASVSNNTEAEVVAVNVKTGKLVGRWAVPEEYRNGFQVQPGLTLFGDGVVLTRNFERWEFEFADYKDVKEPEGDRYDIGVFTFPKPQKAKAGVVATAGPTDTEATALAGLKTTDPEVDRGAGAFTTGSEVVAYGQNVLTAFSTKGKKLWSSTVADDPAARVCAAPTPDKSVKTFTVAVRPGEGKPCSEAIRYDASSGKILARASAPSKERQWSSVRVHDGAVLVIDAKGVVSSWKDGKLAQKARIKNPVYTWETTPEDPDLVVTTSSIKGGKDWTVDAYRLPDLDPVWSTTASRIFGSVDPRNTVTSWRGNPLWMSTTYGDVSDTDAKVRDVLVQLDPATGKVAATTGKVLRDYLADDLKKFSLTATSSAGYVTAGFDDGSVVLPQSKGVVRYSLKDKKALWATDTSSIMASLERERGQAASASPTFQLMDGGKTVLVTLANDTSVELMTLKASDGKITGRWKVPAKARNGLQTSPETVPFKGGVALVHSDYSWDYAYGPSATRKPPKDQRYDVGLFGLGSSKKDD
ncbi:hypothetical protein [Aeromicrobium sp. Root495]|uniref:hypothetical protein n=1 Tax=Aeromicrobium sp. Root495 TaxID=1736550 RepID=UPI000A50A489|nr:hypothetical protein [Aeromicrobium sp. Root495]